MVPHFLQGHVTDISSDSLDTSVRNVIMKVRTLRVYKSIRIVSLKRKAYKVFPNWPTGSREPTTQMNFQTQFVIVTFCPEYQPLYVVFILIGDSGRRVVYVSGALPLKFGVITVLVKLCTGPRP